MKTTLAIVVATLSLFAAFAQSKRVVLVVQNHCSGNVQPPLSALADTLVDSLSGSAFRVVNPHNAIGVRQNRDATGEVMPEMSAVSLAQSQKADGILTASVQEFTSETLGVPPVGYKLKARLSISLADVASGDTVCGVSAVDFGKNYTVEQVKEDNAALFEGHLHAAAERCAAKFLAKAKMADWKPEPVKKVTVFFGCNVLGADIQIDGLSYGTCPTEIEMAPGVHNLLVSYPPYYLDFKRRAMFEKDGQTYSVVLQVTKDGEEHRRRMKEFDVGLEERSELFKRQLDVAKAMLKRYESSGKVDDFVRKTIAEGTAVYWKNSFGRIAITDGTADNIEFATPSTDTGDLVVPPTPNEVGEGLQQFLKKRAR